MKYMKGDGIGFDQGTSTHLMRKDAKDGAAGQCRASANSNDGVREQVPQPGGDGRNGERAQAHITIKQGRLRFVKLGRI